MVCAGGETKLGNKDDRESSQKAYGFWRKKHYDNASHLDQELAKHRPRRLQVMAKTLEYSAESRAWERRTSNGDRNVKDCEPRCIATTPPNHAAVLCANP